MHKQGVRNFYVGCCCEIFATDIDDLSVESATLLLCKATSEQDCSVEQLTSADNDEHTIANSLRKRQEERRVWNVLKSQM